MRSGRAAVALLCGALLLLPGCGSGGSGKPIPAATANRLIALIGLADQRSQAGECLSAAAKVREAQSVRIPSSVKSSVRQGIADGLDRLASLIASQCQRPQRTQTTPTQTQTTQTLTTQSQTTPTTQTQTQTTQTQTTDTSTVPTSTTPTTTTGTTTTGTSTGNGGVPTGTGTGAQAGNQG